MTKPSEHFRDTIREYLEQRASADALFAASCAKEQTESYDKFEDQAIRWPCITTMRTTST